MRPTRGPGQFGDLLVHYPGAAYLAAQRSLIEQDVYFRRVVSA